MQSIVASTRGRDSFSCIDAITFRVGDRTSSELLFHDNFVHCHRNKEKADRLATLKCSDVYQPSDRI